MTLVMRWVGGFGDGAEKGGVSAGSPAVRYFATTPAPAFSIAARRSSAEGLPIPASEQVRAACLEFIAARLRSYLMSLPLYCGGPYCPPQSRYLRASASSTARWKDVFRAMPGLKVGLVWMAGDYQTSMFLPRIKSVPAAALSPWAKLEGISWISLQKTFDEEKLDQAVAELPMPVFNPMHHIENMDDTAALIEQLDLVISVDTAVVHLAAALGVPTWGLIRKAGGWPWGPAVSGPSVWYPNLWSFRQQKLDDWSWEIKHIGHLLSTLSRHRNAA